MNDELAMVEESQRQLAIIRDESIQRGLMDEDLANTLYEQKMKELEQVKSEIVKQGAKERLKIIQEKLFQHQREKNKSLESKYIDVLVENEIEDQKKLFARNDYMTSVIFDGSKNLIGKVVPVKIKNSNQNSLFGEIDLNNKFIAA